MTKSTIIGLTPLGSPYFGWMHQAAAARRMLVENLLQKPIVVVAPPPAPVPWHLQCPHCAHFTLVCVGALPRQARAPPTCRP